MALINEKLTEKREELDGKTLEETMFNLDVLKTREDRQRGYRLESDDGGEVEEEEDGV